MSHKHVIFTYGTLKQGFGNHRLIKDAKLLGEATTVKPYLLMSFGGFPGMYEEPKDVTKEDLTNVRGDLYEITDSQLASCDCLEGHPRFYKRTPIEVTLDGKVVKCETYFYQGAVHGTPCYEGIWPQPHRNQ